MSTRDVRDAIVRGFETVLAEEHVPASRQRHAALKLAVVVEAHGVRLVRPAAIHDPNADWRKQPEPGDQQTGATRAWAVLSGTAICQVCRTEQSVTRDGVIAEHDITDDHGNTFGCLGSSADPAFVPRTSDRTPR